AVAEKASNASAAINAAAAQTRFLRDIPNAPLRHIDCHLRLRSSWTAKEAQARRSSALRRKSVTTRAGLALAALAMAGLVGAVTFTDTSTSPVWAQGAAPLTPVKVGVRRLTESQYRHAIADTFGDDIKISARFEPEKREEGLLAVGSAQLSITGSGFEQYFALANSIA